MTPAAPAADPPWRAALRAAVLAPLRAAYWRTRTAKTRRRVLSGRHYEPLLCRALRKHLHPGAVCVDVGANTGIISAFMAHHAGPEAKIYAFEPCPDNQPRFDATLHACRLQGRVQFIGAAVNDGSVQTLQLYRGRGESHSEWNIIGRDTDGNPTTAGHTVPAVSLDAWFPPNAHIDLVKIDVEGAEYQVLAGMNQILNRCRPTLVIECHCADNWRACARLADRGYTLRDLRGSALDPAAHYPTTHLLATAA